MTPTSTSASAAGSAAAEGTTAPAGSATEPAAAGPFVLNLCSSTTPMALAKLESPELKRFSFFVSRRFEEGRERFRLHMGYFSTLAEAEEWLSAVRDIYPGAWAGEAPGKKLRERAVAAAAAQAQHAAGPPPRAAEARAAMESSGGAAPTLRASRPAEPAAPVPEHIVPTLRAVAELQQPAASVPTLRAASDPGPVPVPSAPLAAETRAIAAKQTAAPAGGARPAASRPTAAPPPRAAAPAPARAAAASSGSASGARAAGAGIPTPPRTPAVRPGQVAGTPRTRASGTLTNTQAMLGTPRMLRTELPAASPAQQPASASRAVPGSAAPHPAAANRTLTRTAAPRQPQQTAGSRKPGPRPSVRIASRTGLPDSNVREVLDALDEVTGETRMMPAPQMVAAPRVAPQMQEPVDFTDTQVLSLLEARRADGSELSGADAATGAISLLKPDDTGTRRALKAAVAENAPVWFAVQLQWSVQPVELTNVPPLAIFSAYTLYTVEGSRDGRKWYGLRLGFFSDAISAKQVAYYVRSEFTSVAVVPVSPQERVRATEADGKVGPRHSLPKKTRVGPIEEFKLIDVDAATPKLPAAPPPKPAARLAGPQRSAALPAGPKRNAKPGNRVRAHEPRAPQTLEETLEILGAGELEIDNGSGETLNESGVRHLRVQVQKNTPFSRLLERLSERVRKS